MYIVDYQNKYSDNYIYSHDFAKLAELESLILDTLHAAITSPEDYQKLTSQEQLIVDKRLNDFDTLKAEQLRQSPSFSLNAVKADEALSYLRDLGRVEDYDWLDEIQRRYDLETINLKRFKALLDCYAEQKDDLGYRIAHPKQGEQETAMLTFLQLNSADVKKLSVLVFNEVDAFNVIEGDYTLIPKPFVRTVSQSKVPVILDNGLTWDIMLVVNDTLLDRKSLDKLTDVLTDVYQEDLKRRTDLD